VEDMKIEKEVESIKIYFEEPYDFYGKSVVKETVGNYGDNNYEITKIEVSNAIFIHSVNLGCSIVDVIPFHQIKKCTVSLKCECI
jgi:hypothetical protein